MDLTESRGFDSKISNAMLKSKLKALRRLPFSRSQKIYSNFKSPVQTQRSPSCPIVVQTSLEKEIEELKRKRKELDFEIAQFESNAMGIYELEQHIDLLHEYNDIKDMGQTLLGRLAVVRGVTTRDLYAHFGLEHDD
ncbi:DNA repair protein SWI5 homolog [Megalops cyprinoides]|uniref:DNA repair protein SWI5 homolog n=1 Tax=Megalops cyprinoides TaxID=118141 RepID=UPI001863EF41|nr:DNA repair protein SWI5 homolog [Megalops cyprinoides]